MNNPLSAFSHPSDLPDVEVSAKQAVTLLVQSLAFQRLKGRQSSTAQKVVQATREAFQRLWTFEDSVELDLSGVVITIGSQTLQFHDSQGDNLAIILFRQGIRRITFHRGFETSELDRFLDSVLNCTTDEEQTGTLSIAWWDEDFDFIQYEVNEPRVEELEIQFKLEELTDQGNNGLAKALANRSKWHEVIPEESRVARDPLALPDCADRYGADRSTVFLTPDEMQDLSREIELEMQRDVAHDIVSAFLDSFEAAAEDKRGAILEGAHALVPGFLAHGYLKEVAYLIKELREIVTTSAFSQQHRNQVQRLIARIETSEAMKQLFDAMEGGRFMADLDSVREFCEQLGAASLERVIRIAEIATHDGYAGVFREAASCALERHPETLDDLLNSSDPVVLRGTLKSVKARNHPATVDKVIRFAKHPDRLVRESAAQALVLVGSQRALECLSSALEDPAVEVRMVALWGIGSWRHRQAIGLIEAKLRRQKLGALGHQEKRALFETYARIGSEAAFSYLSKIVLKRNLLGKRKASELRSCAVRALALLQMPQVRGVLEQAAVDSDLNVRRAVRAVLHNQGQNNAQPTRT